MASVKFYNPFTHQWEYLLQGPKGNKGDKGDTGTSNFLRVHHMSDPNVARPDAFAVEWVGSVAPLNATTDDTWVDTV